MGEQSVLDDVRDILGCPDGKSITQHSAELRAKLAAAEARVEALTAALNKAALNLDLGAQYASDRHLATFMRNVGNSAKAALAAVNGEGEK